MVFQQISVLILVLLATGYTLFRFLRILFPGKNNNPNGLCPGCSGACHSQKTLFQKRINPSDLHIS